MAATRKTANILERCHVAPPANVAEQTLPLTFFDLPWLHFHPIQRLLFYQFPCSKSRFLENLVPKFKQSLSQALKHYLPLSGNLIYPLKSGLPVSRYLPGDSVPVTIAESSEDFDFNYLTGNHPRVADEFYTFFTDLPPPRTEEELGIQIVPLLTVQITLFPGTGICFGLNNHHVIGDASSIVRFIKAWSSIAISGENDEVLAAKDLLPFYDRSVIKDPSGHLMNIFWDLVRVPRIESSPPSSFPVNKVRATFILEKLDMQKLRGLVQSKKPALVHLSSFTVTTAYVWSCLAKAAARGGQHIDDNEPEYFLFAAEARSRLDQPAPAAYFGNCVAPAIAETTHAKLKGVEGFLVAAELISDVIRNKVNDKVELMRDADQWIEKCGSVVGKRLSGVAGSPKFDLYDTDFGWGKPKKFESIGIDRDGSMSLCKSREFEGGLEIGLSLPEKEMDAFAAAYSAGLTL